MGARKSSAVHADTLASYEKLAATNPKVERKGDTNPYTSLNGHMFSHMSSLGVGSRRAVEEDVRARDVVREKLSVHKDAEAKGREIEAVLRSRARTRVHRLRGRVI